MLLHERQIYVAALKKKTGALTVRNEVLRHPAQAAVGASLDFAQNTPMFALYSRRVLAPNLQARAALSVVALACQPSRARPTCHQ